MENKNFVALGKYAIKVALIMAILYLVYDIFYVFMPLALALILALMLQPLVDRLRYVPFSGQKKKIPEVAAILIVMSMVALAIVFGVVFVVLPLFKEVNNLMKVLPQLAERVHSLGDIWNQQVELLNLPSDMQALLSRMLSSASSYALEFLRNTLLSVFDFAKNIIGFLVMPIFTFYFLKDGEKFTRSFIAILPTVWQPKAALIIKDSAAMLSAYIRGIAHVGLISGCVVALGTYIIGLDYPLVFGILAVVAEAIPIIGPVVSVMPGLFFAYLKGGNVFIAAVIFYFVYYKVDAYVIAPKITGASLNLHPVLIITSILVGGQLAGPLGMVLAVPAVALMRVLARNIMSEEVTPHEERAGENQLERTSGGKGI